MSYYNNNPEYSGGGSSGSNYYDQSAMQHASAHHDGGNGDFFANALGFLQGRASSASEGDIDEAHAVQAHQAMYGSGGGSGSGSGDSHDSGTVGAGAAMQALKLFTSGGESDGGMDQNKLIGMAMAQAGKLWDEKEGSGASMSGDKQSAVNSAAEMALKMYLKSQGGIGGTGGPSGLMGLASKFLM